VSDERGAGDDTATGEDDHGGDTGEFDRPPEGMDLPELREEIRSIDREIVELIARRTYVADTIATVKERRELPTVDEHQEQQVMDRAGENAARFEVDRNLVKAVFRMLIELNKIEQRSRRRADAGDRSAFGGAEGTDARADEE
jgi:chorismate mutase